MIFNPRNVWKTYRFTAIISLNVSRACEIPRKVRDRKAGTVIIHRTYKMNDGHSLTCPISRVAQISGEGVRFVISLPLGTAAVVVVCEDLVIVNVTTGEQRAPAWTAHGSGHVRVSQFGALVPYSLQSPRHEVQRTCDGYETIHFGYGQTIYSVSLYTQLYRPKHVHCPVIA